jgi:phosphatidate cytidylyltransferase
LNIKEEIEGLVGSRIGMKNRVLTGIIGGLYLGIATYLGGFLFKFTFLGITLIALYEIDNAINENKDNMFKLNYLIAIFIFVMEIIDIKIDVSTFVSIYAIIIGIIFVIVRGSKFRNLAASYFGMIYIILLLYHTIMFTDNVYIWFIYVITFSADSFAYLIGSTLGKHKLCPKLSPKKTVEGAVAGTFGAIIFALLFNYFIMKQNYLHISIIAAVGSIASIFGDLVASKIKREFNIKDYGNMLPGHGGIMDRFDSFIMVAPVTYYLVLMLIG